MELIHSFRSQAAQKDEIGYTVNSLILYLILLFLPLYLYLMKLKAKSVPVLAMEALGGRGGIAPTHS
jgi:hypothetical protein